jgi:hypothetical protein
MLINNGKMSSGPKELDSSDAYHPVPRLECPVSTHCRLLDPCQGISNHILSRSLSLSRRNATKEGSPARRTKRCGVIYYYRHCDDL